MKKSIAIFFVSFILGCSNTEITENKEDVNDSNSTEKNLAIPIYNHAYNENFDSDKISDILDEARGAYVLLDTFDDRDLSAEIIKLKENNNQIGGYISAGTAEDWREDFNDLEPFISTKVWDDWAGEYYIKETDTGVLDIMQKRIDKMAKWGVEWVEYDNMDWVYEENRKEYDLTVTIKESREYINSLCAYTQSKGMKCMAKNTVKGFEHFEGVLYESSKSNKNWWNTKGTKNFLEAKKLVIINHYNENNQADCDKAYSEYKSYYQSDSLSFICEDRGLQAYRHYREE